MAEIGPAMMTPMLLLSTFPHRDEAVSCGQAIHVGSPGAQKKTWI